MARGSLVQGFAITATQTQAYQAPNQIVKALLQKAEIVNTGATVVKVNVWITPDSATTPTNAHKVLVDRQVGSGQTYVAIELIGEYINTGGKVYVQSDVLGCSLWLNGNTFKTEV